MFSLVLHMQSACLKWAVTLAFRIAGELLHRKTSVDNTPYQTDV